MKLLSALLFLAATATAAAQIKISAFPTASALSGPELTIVVQGGVTKQSTAAALVTLAAGTLAPINSPTFTGTGTIPSGWTIGGYLTTTAGDAAYQPKATKLTNFAALADAAGFFASDGAGNYSWTASTIGGNGTADAGKAVLFGTNGSLIARSFVRCTNGTDYTGLGSGGIQAQKSSQVLSIVWPTSPTGSRTYTMPDKSGTVAMTSDITGTNSGTNTGDQTITLTGNVTGSGTGSFATTIAAGAVTDSMLAGSITPSKITGTAAILGANTYTGAQAINFTSQGTSPSTALTVASTTAATVGAQVEQSPLIVLQGSGWKTNATAAAQTVAFTQGVVPIAGTAAPSGTWNLAYSINGGAAVNTLVANSNGDFTLGTSSAGKTTAYRIRAVNRYEISTGNDTTYQMGIGSDFGNAICLCNNWLIAWSNNANANAGSRTLVLGRDAAFTAGVLQLGQDDPTTATAQTIQAHSVTTGAGPNLQLKGGTGSTTSGGVVSLSNFSVPTGSAGATSINFGTVGTGIYQSAANEVAISTGSSQRMRINSTALTVTGQIIDNGGYAVMGQGPNGFQTWSGGYFGWTSLSAVTASSTPDTFFCRKGAQNIGMGSPSSATPSPYFLGGSEPNTWSNTNGGDVTFATRGTGTGLGGSWYIKSSLGGSSGTSLNSSSLLLFAATPTGGVQFMGTPTNDSAAAGNVGENVQSFVASGAPVALTTATGANVTSISLTAGDWDVTGVVSIAYTSATVTGASAGISTTTATVPTDGGESYSAAQLTTTTVTDSMTVTATRVSVSTTTTVYLTVKSSFSAGTAGAFGKIQARRRR